MKEDTQMNGVLLETDFFKKYFFDTEADFLKIYIYIKSTGQATITDVAQKLSMPLGKVYEAVEFWVQKAEMQEKDGRIILGQPQKSTPKIRFDQRPEYDSMELQMYSEKNPEVKMLFDMAHRYLGRLLSFNDLSGVFGLYHWLGLSIPLIEKLLAYCVENNHRNIRYIEKVAMDWVENNITTPEAAEEKLRMYNVDFRKIMKAMGQSSRNPIAKEEQYMTAWIQELKMPIGVIEYACEKTVLNTGKAAFGYANKILINWKEAGIETIEDTFRLEEKQSQITKEAKKNSETTVKRQRKNRFVNFEQRTYDFETYERMELERIIKENQKYQEL